MLSMMINSGIHKGKLVEVIFHKFGYIVFVLNSGNMDMLPEYCLDICQ